MKNLKFKKEKKGNIFKSKNKNVEIITIKKEFGLYRLNDKEAISKYFDICRKISVEASLNKKLKEIKEEAEKYLKVSQKNSLNKNKLLKKINLIEYIDLVENKTIKKEEHPAFFVYYNYYKSLSEDYKKEFKKLIFALKGVEFGKYVKTNQVSTNYLNPYERERYKINYEKDKTFIIIKNIINNRANWLRSDFKDFKIKTKNNEKALLDVVSYLFEKYKTNKMFLTLFKESEVKYSQICINIAQGEKPKKVFEKHLPEISKRLTKKMYHKLLIEQTNKTFLKRLREIMISNFQDKIKKAVLNSNKAEDFKQEEGLFNEFLIYLNNKDLSFFSGNQIMPLFDYVVSEKQRAQNVNVLFRLKDHPLDRLYEGMLNWHRELNKTTQDFEWKEVLGIYKREYKKEINNAVLKKEVAVVEITNSKDLREEGKKLRHCVASYASSCKRGTCSIFSLRIKEFEGESLKPKITIEIREGKVVQTRGTTNRIPTQEERKYIKDWANYFNLIY